jgi:hypothetical protein
MCHIQDFKKEFGDAPHIMYVRLAQFVRESGEAFTEQQLVALYMEKQDKKLQDMAHLYMLLQFGGRAILAQAFAIVEQLDKGFCVEETGRMLSIMTTTLNQLKSTIAGSSKSKGTSKSSKLVAMAAKVEVPANLHM